MAFKHAKLYLAIKLKSGTQISQDIKDLNLDVSDLDINTLEMEIKEYWAKF